MQNLVKVLSSVFARTLHIAMIQEPYILSILPEAPSAGGGRAHAADIHSLAASRKRKRSELALAIDHQGVNIFDVCYGLWLKAHMRSLTSYLDHILEVSDLVRCFAVNNLHLPTMLNPLSTNNNYSKSKVHILLYDLFKGVDTMLSTRHYPGL